MTKEQCVKIIQEIKNWNKSNLTGHIEYTVPKDNYSLRVRPYYDISYDELTDLIELICYNNDKKEKVNGVYLITGKSVTFASIEPSA
jgi:hypothetical protein